jgi:hypothetical protein
LTFLKLGFLGILFAISQTVYVPWQTKEKRVFPVEMLFMKTTVLLVILAATGAATLIITLYYIPIYFQFTRVCLLNPSSDEQGDLAIKSAVRLLPAIFMMVVGSIGSGLLLSKFGYYAPFYIIGSGMGIIASAFLFRTTAETSDAVIYLLSAVMGLGSGIYDQAGFSVAQIKVPKEQTGQAIGFLSAGQLMGVVVTITICGTVMLDSAIEGLASLLPDVSLDVIESMVAGTAGETLQSLPPDIRSAALNVIVNAINKVYLVTLTVASVGLVFSLLFKHERIFVTESKEANK